MRFGKRNILKSSEIDLGSAVLDSASGRVFDSNGSEIELRHQSREVLMALAGRPGETVSREALLDDVWSGRAVSADSVAQCIAEIRRVLGDNDKIVVETVPREGYRLRVPDPESAPLRKRFHPLPALVVLVLAAGTIAFALLARPNAPTATPVIAVLPFEDFSAAPHQGYLSDAVSESIITDLARYSQLIVISRRSSFKFRNSDLGIPEIARQLNADFVLEGSQQFDGEQLRITAQLIDGSSNAHIWADEVNVPLGSLLETNSQISRKIANSVGASVIDAAAAQMTQDDVSALMISNAAQSRIMRSFTRENLMVNIKEQEQSIKDYPDSAWGHLGQALSLRVGLRYGWIEGDEAMTRKRMEELARRGVALDPNNFMAYHALGRVLMYNRDVEAAIGAFRHGVELNPSSSIVAGGLADALIYVGNTDEALDVIAKTERIDPLYGFSVQWAKATALWQIKECGQALEAFQSAPSMPVAANKVLSAIHICTGDRDKAVKAMADYIAENPDWTVSRERSVNSGMWTAPGALDRWLTAMEAAEMPL